MQSHRPDHLPCPVSSRKAPITKFRHTRNLLQYVFVHRGLHSSCKSPRQFWPLFPGYSAGSPLDIPQSYFLGDSVSICLYQIWEYFYRRSFHKLGSVKIHTTRFVKRISLLTIFQILVKVKCVKYLCTHLPLQH